MSPKAVGLVVLMAIIGLGTFACTVTVDGAGGKKGTTPPDGVEEDDNGFIPEDGDGNAADDRDQLETGRSDHTLGASETKTFRINVERSETLIVNTSLPDSTTDVDMYAYGPTGNRLVASTEGSPSGFDNLTFLADEAGQYAIEVVNLSPSQRAELSLTVQRVPAREAVESLLNGVYKITEGGGDPVSSSSSTWFVFSDGELTSVYGVIDAEEFGLAEDYRYWVDGTSEDLSELHTVDLDVVLRVNTVDTQQDGSSLTFDYDVVADVSRSPVGPARLEQTYHFEGLIADEGRVIRGTASQETEADGFPWSSDVDSVKMERTDE